MANVVEEDREKVFLHISASYHGNQSIGLICQAKIKDGWVNVCT